MFVFCFLKIIINNIIKLCVFQVNIQVNLIHYSPVYKKSTVAKDGLHS
jgi:hypothetical protein